MRMVQRIVLGLLLVAVAFAQPRKPVLPGEDWVQLFNGKDLTGWVEVGKEKWTVEDGTIHGMGISKAYGYLMTEKSYKDFHMAIQFKCEGDGNSGVFFHTAFKPGTPDVSQGMQFEIDCALGKHTGGMYGDGRQWIVWPSAETPKATVSMVPGSLPRRSMPPAAVQRNTCALGPSVLPTTVVPSGVIA
jgi:hypothetical protein